MLRFFENFHWIFSSIGTVLLFVVFSCMFLWLVRKYITPGSLKSSHDVVGFTYSIVGVLYAVLLGFTVVNVQERFNSAKEISETEANYMADLYRDSIMLGAENGADVRHLVVLYIKEVLDEEWALMDTGRPSEKVAGIVKSLWEIYYSVEPKNIREQIWLTESVSKLNDFTNVRLKRIYNSNDSLSPILWTLLYVGAIITIVFLGLFHIENFKLHLFVMALLSGLIGFMLYLIQALDSVYYGDISVRPEALERVQEFLGRWY